MPTPSSRTCGLGSTRATGSSSPLTASGSRVDEVERPVPRQHRLLDPPQALRAPTLTRRRAYSPSQCIGINKRVIAGTPDLDVAGTSLSGAPEPDPRGQSSLHALKVRATASEAVQAVRQADDASDQARQRGSLVPVELHADPATARLESDRFSQAAAQAVAFAHGSTEPRSCRPADAPTADAGGRYLDLHGRGN